jgi:branched-chain amino acid transport system substrate-binding protein
MRQNGSAGTALPKVITIDADMALSGQVSVIGQQVQNGIRIGVVDARAILPHTRIQVNFFDDGFKAAQAASNFSTMVAQHPTALIGPLGSLMASASFPIAQSAGIPVVGVTAPNSVTLAIGNDIFQTTPLIADAAATSELNALKKIGVSYQKPAFMISQQTLGEQQYASAIERVLAKQGINPVASVSIDETATNFSAISTQVINSHPSVVFILAASTASPLVLRQLRAAGYTDPVAGSTDVVPANFPTTAGANNINGLIGISYWFPAYTNGPASRKFVREYIDAYGASALSFYAAQGHDAMIAIATAVKNAMSADPTKVRAGLAKVKFSGALGTNLAFDKQGVVTGTHIAIVQWRCPSTCGLATKLMKP